MLHTVKKIPKPISLRLLADRGSLLEFCGIYIHTHAKYIEIKNIYII